MEEIWLDYPDYEDFYQVSNLGRIKSLPRVMQRSNGRIFTTQERILTQNWSGGTDIDNKYLGVGLSRDGGQVKRRVHRMVLETFVGPCPEGQEGLHRDGDKANNSLANVSWGTHAENMRDRDRHGKTVRPRGESNGRSILTGLDIPIIRASSLSVKELAARYGVGVGTIHHVQARISWRHIA